MRNKTVLLGIITVLTACGGDVKTPESRPSAILSGVSADNLIRNGDVRVYNWSDGVERSVIMTTETDQYGLYKNPIQAEDQFIKICVESGSYVEESSGITIQLNETDRLCGISFWESGQEQSMMITPETNMAAAYAECQVKLGETNLQNIVSGANSRFGALFGYNIQTTIPFDVSDEQYKTTPLNDSVRSGLWHAAFSAIALDAAEDNGFSSHNELASSIRLHQLIYKDIASDCKLDGYGVGSNGVTPIQLAMGSYTLDTNVYRTLTARKLVEFIESERNNTAVEKADVVSYATAFSSSTDGIYSPDAAPEAFDDQGPELSTNTDNGTYVSGDYVYSLKSSDFSGVLSVKMIINGITVSAADADNPVFTINTRQYPEGELAIQFIAEDILNNVSVLNRDVNVANTSPVVNITSETLVNSTSYTFQASIANFEQGIVSASASGQELAIGSDTLEANLTLEQGVNDLVVTLLDGTGATHSYSFRVNADLQAPTLSFAFDGWKTHYKNTLSDIVTLENLTQFSSSNKNLYIAGNRRSLAGIAIDDSSFRSTNWAVLRASVVDSATPSNPYFTSSEKLKINLVYRSESAVIHTRKITTTEAGGNIIVAPLSTEYLGANWWENTSDVFIDIEAEDEAGNVSTLSMPVSFSNSAPALDLDVSSSDIFSDTATIDLTGTDLVGIDSISISLNGGTPTFIADLSNPSYQIDTNGLSDGVHYFDIVIRDRGETVFTQRYEITVDNTKPTIVITSPELVNSRDYLVTANISEVNSISNATINGVDVSVAFSGDVSREINLAGDVNTVLVTATDSVGNPALTSKDITVDDLAPSVTLAQDQAAFSTYVKNNISGRISVEAFNLPLQGKQLYVTPARRALNGVIVSEASLSALNLPFLKVNAADLTSSIVSHSTPVDSLVYELQFKNNGELVKTTALDNVPATGTVIIPFATEFLGEDWWLAGDSLTLTVTAKDDVENIGAITLPFTISNAAPSATLSILNTDWVKATQQFLVDFYEYADLFLVSATAKGQSSIEVTEQDGSFSLDTTKLEDGLNHIDMKVIEKSSGQEIYNQRYEFNVDNTAPVVNLTSKLLVSDRDYIAEASVVDVNAKSTKINNELVTVNQGLAIKQMPLPLASNAVTVSVDDYAGNVTTITKNVLVDDLAPSVSISDNQSSFTTYAKSKTNSAVEVVNNIAPLTSHDIYITPALQSLGQTNANEAELISSKRAFYSVDVEDQTSLVVSHKSSTNDMSYSVKFLKDGAVLNEKSLGNIPNTGKLIIPFTTEYLGADFWNKTGTLTLAVTATDELENSSTQIFPVSFIEAAPTATLEVNDEIWVNDNANLPVSLTEFNDLFEVRATPKDADAISINGEAPILSYNTKAFADGATYVDMSVIEKSTNQPLFTERFNFNIDNTAPILSLTSDLIVSDRSYIAQATVNDVNPKAVSINGNSVALNSGKAVQALNLPLASNAVTVIAEDKSGNITTLTKDVLVDDLEPSVSIASNQSSFTTYAKNKVNGSVEVVSNLSPLASHDVYITPALQTLGSINANEVELAATKRAFYSIDVEDQTSLIVTHKSAANDMRYSVKFLKDGATLNEKELINIPNTGKLIIPFTTEYLGTDFWKKSGTLTLAVTAKDELDNLATQVFPISFVEAAPTATLAVNDESWVNDNADLPVSLTEFNELFEVKATPKDSDAITIDGETPVLSYNTKTFSDGATYVDMSVIEKSTNQALFTERFNFNIDNTAPILALTSDLLVNDRNYIAQATVNDVNPKSVSINGNVVSLNAGKAIQALNLPLASNAVTVRAEDKSGNITNLTKNVLVDDLSPTIALASNHGSFLSYAMNKTNGAIETTGVVFPMANHDIYVTPLRESLGSVAATQSSLSATKRPFLKVNVVDPISAIVTHKTGVNDLAYSLQFRSGGSVISERSISNIPNTGDVIVPFTTEYLGANFWAQSGDLNVNVIASDELGNTQSQSFAVSFVEAAPTASMSVQASDWLRSTVSLPVALTEPSELFSVTATPEGKSSIGITPNAATISFDTTGYSEGSHYIDLAIRENGASTDYWSNRYTFKVDNTAPSVSVTSGTTQNEISYRLTANVSDTGSGVTGVSVNGAAVGSGNINKTLTLASGINNISVVAGDGAGNIRTVNHQVSVDVDAPIFNSNSIPATTVFYNAGNDTTPASATLSFNPAGNPFFFDSDHISLNGTQVSREALDAENYVYWAVSVTDPEADGAYTPYGQNKVTYSMWHGGTKKIADRELTVPVSGWANRYIVPLTTEYFGDDFYIVDSDTNVRVEFKVTDLVGNTSTQEHNFKIFAAPLEAVATPVFSTVTNPTSLINEDIDVFSLSVTNTFSAPIIVNIPEINGTLHSLATQDLYNFKYTEWDTVITDGAKYLIGDIYFYDGQSMPDIASTSDARCTKNNDSDHTGGQLQAGFVCSNSNLSSGLVEYGTSKTPDEILEIYKLQNGYTKYESNPTVYDVFAPDIVANTTTIYGKPYYQEVNNPLHSVHQKLKGGAIPDINAAPFANKEEYKIIGTKDLQISNVRLDRPTSFGSFANDYALIGFMDSRGYTPNAAIKGRIGADTMQGSSITSNTRLTIGLDDKYSNYFDGYKVFHGVATINKYSDIHNTPAVTIGESTQKAITIPSRKVVINAGETVDINVETPYFTIEDSPYGTNRTRLQLDTFSIDYSYFDNASAPKRTQNIPSENITFY